MSLSASIALYKYSLLLFTMTVRVFSLLFTMTVRVFSFYNDCQSIFSRDNIPLRFLPGASTGINRMIYQWVGL